MRPTRLEISGFASFRERTVIDFGDADLFVLTGPTGAGKSSIIDAITFALYGAVPRYDNRNLVAPIITQGMLEAKVRLDFTVGGEAYTAVRVVRRTATGASTREARLEHNGRSLAENANDLTARITDLLGLTFDHFQKCVVLPQGDFARFLHDPPRDRQDLLVKLLDLEVYREMARVANQRAAVADSQARNCQERLEGELRNATEENLELLRSREQQLAELVERIEQDAPRLEDIAARRRSAEQEADTARRACQLLEALRTPDGVDQLANELAAAEAAARSTAEALRDAAEQVEHAVAALEQLPARAELEAARRDYADAVRIEQELRRAESEVRSTAEKERRANAACDAAEQEFEAARERRQQILHDNYAYAVAQKLRKGDTCPVCGEVLQSDPRLETPEGLEQATADRDAAQERLNAARAALERAQREAERAAARSDALDKQAAELRKRLHGQPSPAELEELLAKVDVAEKRAQQARAAQKQAAQAQRAAEGRLEQLREHEDAAWRDFDRARDSVATLDPPDIPRRELAAAWATLVGWARAQLPAQQSAVAAAEDRIRELDAERERILEEQRSQCAALDVQVTAGSPRDAARAAYERAGVLVQALQEQLEIAGQLREELRRHREEAEVARTLHEHLRTNRFENWYLGRAFRRLVRRASDLLEELSNNQYALDVTETNDFVVIDHTNADERRFIRTLSGGETFLASLSLALALADNLADMAANGAARLEAIFLDEGFGTLDPDTLDTVASALEELGSGGRMVGVVTHVRDLAERLPVRFEVRKEGRSSRVEKVMV